MPVRLLGLEAGADSCSQLRMGKNRCGQLPAVLLRQPDCDGVAVRPRLGRGAESESASCPPETSTGTSFRYNPGKGRPRHDRARPAPTSAPSPAMLTIDYRVPRDAAFKHFVYNKTYLRHLLRAHPLAGIDEADVVAIDIANSNLVGPQLSQRLADAAWRLTMSDGSLVYLLIECQSDVDPTMPFRILHEVATLYLALSKEPPRESGYSPTAVPRVKHLTIYSGKRPWTVPREVGAAIEAGCAGAELDIPRMECPVLDLRRCPDPGGDGNLAVLLGRLQRCENPEELRAAAQPLKKWSGNEEHTGLAGAFAAWISEVLIPDLGVTDAAKSDNLKEVLDMLEAESLTWADRMRAEGHDEGLRKGRREGRRDGLHKGHREGERKGERNMILRLARVRFGEQLADSLAVPLEGIADVDRLEEIGEWLLTCESGEALLARLQPH